MSEWALYWLKVRTAWWYLVWVIGEALKDKSVRRHRELDKKLRTQGLSVEQVIRAIEDQK